MNKIKKYLLILSLLVNPIISFTQTTPEVIIPKFNDKYTKFIKELETGKTEIDYREFRESFIQSDQFKVANDKSNEFDSLINEMYNQMDKSNYQEVIKITKAMLSIDYTSMLAHKILRQTYKIVGDTINAQKYKNIQFGLLNSIVKNGDGKTCETAWPVIQIEEERFILQMIGAEMKHQGIENVGQLCDKMEVTEDGKDKVYYFEVSKVFEGYKKLGIE